MFTIQDLRQPVPLLGVHRAVLTQRVGLCVAATVDMSWTLMANPAQVS